MYVSAIDKVKPNAEVAEAQHLLQQIIDVNLRYKNKFHDIISHSTLQQQTPHATVVLCSDSRVDSDILSDTPTGEMFVIRNIGNQLPTAYGSVEYGVNHLKTQMLIIVGHSGCGAVKAAMQDYGNESEHIKQELGTLHINPKDSLNHNLVKNVNNQVRTAVKMFHDRIQNESVVVIGMIYDMHDDFNFGHGQLILVNINNQTAPDNLVNNKYIKGLHNLVVYGRD